jgi:tRNA pseudouridine-54 N-methylase
VDGWKLVQGKQGHRKWADPAAAEALFKSMRLRQDEMYDLALISPTTAEKVLKTSPKRWERVQPHIVRAEGKPSVAPATDKRPALAVQSVADDFRDVMSTAN